MFTRLRGRLRRPSPATAIALVALVVALGGVAYAAIPSSSGVFRGCYATTEGIALGIPHSKGDTRLVNEGEACRSYEKLVTWNQQGPKGDQGIQGPKGDTGPAGPADAFSTGEGGGVTVGASPRTVQSLALPAGKYVLTATVSGSDAECFLDDTPDPLVTSSRYRFSNLPDGAIATGSLQGAASSTSAHTITLQCFGDPGGVVTGSINAIKVTTINGS